MPGTLALPEPAPPQQPDEPYDHAENENRECENGPVEAELKERATVVHKRDDVIDEPHQRRAPIHQA